MTGTAIHNAHRTPGYRPDIDGLRALAVLSVVVFHYGFALDGGFIGVDIFFVISGFLVGGQIYDAARHGTFSYRRFYVRRAKRIVPALLVVLACTFVAMLLVATPRELAAFGRDAVASVLSVSNVTLWQSIDYFRPVSQYNPLLMTWSLAIEEQFYIAAPAIIALLSKLAPRRLVGAIVLLIVLSLTASIAEMTRHPSTAFYLIPFRAWELAAGTLLAVLNAHRASPDSPADRATAQNVLSLVGLACIAFPLLRYDAATPFPGAAAITPVAGTVFLLASPRAFVNRVLLGHPLARWFGLLSYSLYLWHWPVISIARLVSETEPSAAVRGALLLLSIALAWLSLVYVEMPFRASRPQRERTVLVRYAGVMTAGALVFASSVFAHGYPQRWPERFVAAEAQSVPAPDPCLVPYGVTRPNRSARCASAGTTGVDIALVGDSHAAALAPGLRRIAAERGFGFAQLTKSSCPFLIGVSRRVDIAPRNVGECAAFNTAALAQVAGDPRIRTVVIAGYWEAGLRDDGAYTALGQPSADRARLLAFGLANAVTRLREAGKSVVIVRDVPFINVPPIKRLAGCLNGIRQRVNGLSRDPLACSSIAVDQTDLDTRGNRVLDTVATQTSTVLADPVKTLCDAHRCRFFADNQMLYIDQQHLSAGGALRVSAAIRANVDESLSFAPPAQPNHP
ncbi:acyltransferase family protein [Burkholderia pyrrocinia]|uniref:acyltransferase family protein n=1 Tax=Burkholderia pyrrocinia TaxID=60550 RepID=UPI00069F7260|nr:acyltransferase family protein [Burkholderia pyrrocinia]